MAPSPMTQRVSNILAKTPLTLQAKEITRYKQHKQPSTNDHYSSLWYQKHIQETLNFLFPGGHKNIIRETFQQIRLKESTSSTYKISSKLDDTWSLRCIDYTIFHNQQKLLPVLGQNLNTSKKSFYTSRNPPNYILDGVCGSERVCVCVGGRDDNGWVKRDPPQFAPIRGRFVGKLVGSGAGLCLTRRVRLNSGPIPKPLPLAIPHIFFLLFLDERKRERKVHIHLVS